MPMCKNLVARILAATPQGLIDKPLLCCLASFRCARIWEKDETGWGKLFGSIGLSEASNAKALAVAYRRSSCGKVGKHSRREAVTLQASSTLSRTHLRETFGMEPDCSSGSDLLISLPPCKGRYDPEHTYLDAYLSVNVILLVVFRQITWDVSVICKPSNYIGHVLESSMFSVRSRAFLVIVFSVPIAAVDRNYGIIQPVRI